MNKRLLKNNWRYMNICLLLTLCISAIGVASAYFLGEILKFAVENDNEGFYNNLFLGLGSALSILLLTFINSIFKSKLSTRIAYDLRRSTARNAIAYSNSNLQIDSGKFSSLLRVDIQKIAEDRIMSIITIAGSIASSIGALSLAFWYSWIVGLVLLAISTVLVLVPLVISKKLSKLSLEYQNSVNNYSGLIENDLSYFKSYVFLGGLKLLKTNLNTSNKAYEMRLKKLFSVYSFWSFFVTLAALVFQALCAGFAGIIYYNDLISVAALVATISLQGIMVNNFSNLLSALPTYIGSKKLYKNRIKEFKRSDSILSIEKLVLQNWNIIVEDKKWFKEDINVQLRKNNRYLITGKNGVGKSLLVSSLFNTENVVGDIFVNDTKADYLWYSGLFWLLPTKPKIFAGNISQNISLFDENPELEEIRRIMIGLGLEKINLETPCNDLSDGQKQRISIARAIYGKAEWVVLDEAISSLDLKTAQLTLKFLSKEIKTLCLISHSEIMERGWFKDEIKIS